MSEPLLNAETNKWILQFASGMFPSEAGYRLTSLQKESVLDSYVIF
jgi:hypothetical protein